MAAAIAMQTLKLRVFGLRSLSHYSHLKPQSLCTIEATMIRTCHSSGSSAIGHSDLNTFYKGRSVFVTGVTGFMGKVLIEKLLRSCSQLENVYVLIRPKKGHDVKQRLEDLLNSKIFDRLKEERPAAIQKLVAINGDVTQAHLGMSEVDEKTLIENVSVVFHSAATVKFDEEFRLAVQLNCGGVINIVQLCKKIPDFKAFVYISTAYSNTNRNEIEEKVYPVCEDPVALVKSLQQGWVTNELVEAIGPVLCKGRPNTYAYTKALAETILLNEGRNLPIAIVRPSIVVAAWKEPFPGWVDSLFGSTGLQLGILKGIMRTVYAKLDKVADCVPVDICINLMIAAAWQLAKHPKKEVSVYNCTIGGVHPVTWGDLIKVYNSSAIKNPANGVLWYPKITAKHYRFHHEICVLCFHYFPAICLDSFARLFGQRPGLFKMHRKIHAVLSAFEEFTTKEWKFTTENQWPLWEAMSVDDKRDFYFDVRQIDWTSFAEQYCLGIKLYMLKEDLSTLPKARKHLKRMKYVRNLTYVLGILFSGSAIGFALNYFFDFTNKFRPTGSLSIMPRKDGSQ